MKAGDHLDDRTEYVFYCPECDGVHVMNGNNAYVFDAGNGPFVHVWERGQLGIGIKMHDLYLMGEL